jgi:murein L,D-transpeptidase YcbB/YkuD
MPLPLISLGAALLLAQLPPATGASAAVIQRMVESGRHPDLHWPSFVTIRPALIQLYASRGFEPLWFKGDSLTLPARAMIRVLGEARTRGLDPVDYDHARLESASKAGIQQDAAQRARIDLALTIAAARLSGALRHGQVDPAKAHVTLRLPVDSFSLDSTLTALAGTTQPNAILQRLEPTFLHYWLVMAALGRYRDLARDTMISELPPIPRRLRPDSVYAGTAQLRRLLRLLGDYNDTASTAMIDTLYAGEVVEAVKRFQERQGFTPDGIIGDSTRIRLLNPFRPRIRQMELTLERWRWMPRRYTAPPIIVNVPAFRLYAFSTMQSAELSLLRMNVVVGKAFRHETPVFAANMTYLTFAPYWDVTPTIAAEEVKPMALKDPDYLARNRFELVENGQVVPSDSAHIARINRGVRVRQQPGGHNALGGVKFIMPNEHNIYLHDTPSRGSFSLYRRDASHGCIRLGEPFALAKFVLRDKPEWTDEKIRAAMKGETPRTVTFNAPIPVLIVYATSMAREDGRVFFYGDIYKHDAKLDRLMKAGYN